jgi:hypothetical protein
VPVDRSGGHTGRVAVVSLVALVLLAGGLWLAAALLSNNPSVDVRLGDDVFDAGKTGRIAAEIAERGPLIYSDVAGRSEDIIVQHLGSDPERGWLAFSAHKPGGRRDCFLEWNRKRKLFVDTCDRTSFPPDGEGLRHYDVTVRNGRVEVDLTAT